jgi:hypothetical protein
MRSTAPHLRAQGSRGSWCCRGLGEGQWGLWVSKRLQLERLSLLLPSLSAPPSKPPSHPHERHHRRLERDLHLLKREPLLARAQCVQHGLVLGGAHGEDGDGDAAGGRTDVGWGRVGEFMVCLRLNVWVCFAGFEAVASQAHCRQAESSQVSPVELVEAAPGPRLREALVDLTHCLVVHLGAGGVGVGLVGLDDRTVGWSGWV